MSRLLRWVRTGWRKATGAERASDDLPEHHEGPAASDLLRTLPPGGGGKL